MYDLKPGTQIAYIPLHADGDLNHPDVQYGFVNTLNPRDDKAVFCRYWRKGKEGQVLRTTANSELTNISDLRIVEKCLQGTIIRTMKGIQNETY